MPHVDVSPSSPSSRARSGFVLLAAGMVVTLALGADQHDADTTPLAWSETVPVLPPSHLHPTTSAIEAALVRHEGPPSARAAVAPAVDTEAQERPWTLAFGGDVHFEGLLGQRLADDPWGMLVPVADLLGAADLAVVNLETAVTERGESAPKGFTFRTTLNALEALKRAGVDVVSIANNHGMDFGLIGLEDTLAAADITDLPMVGAGSTADEAYAPFTAEVASTSFAVLGATQVLDSALIESWTAGPTTPGLASAKDRPALLSAVTEAASSHDVVVVFLHWGVEGETCPTQSQMSLADELVAAGADIIVGGHAHRVQAGGFKGDAVIHYGLGNFVFYRMDGPGTDSGVLVVRGAGDHVHELEWVPAQLTDGVATPIADPQKRAAARDAWSELRDCADLSPTAG